MSPLSEAKGLPIAFITVTAAIKRYCPELPGCASAGGTEEEALENATEGIWLLSQ